MGYNDADELYNENECTEFGNDPPHAIEKQLEERVEEARKEGLSMRRAEKLKVMPTTSNSFSKYAWRQLALLKSRLLKLISNRAWNQPASV